MIKPLEWVDYRDSEGSAPRWKAVHPFGEYRIILNLRDMEYWSPQLGGFSVCWNTLEDAQQAAQSDFASRIRSCLIDKPEADGWRPADTAPKTGFFLAWTPDHPDLVMTFKAEIFHQSRTPGTPKHLSANHFTLWMPIPLPGAADA